MFIALVDDRAIPARRYGIVGHDLQWMTLCLTFDDGLGEHSAELAKFLYAEDITATFFLRGCRAVKDVSLIEQHVRYGHSVANHTWDHKTFSNLTPNEIVLEMCPSGEGHP